VHQSPELPFTLAVEPYSRDPVYCIETSFDKRHSCLSAIRRGRPDYFGAVEGLKLVEF
jgi:hypothetical protein